jgi:hypothetical protein
MLTSITSRVSLYSEHQSFSGTQGYETPCSRGVSSLDGFTRASLKAWEGSSSRIGKRDLTFSRNSASFFGSHQPADWRTGTELCPEILLPSLGVVSQPPREQGPINFVQKLCFLLWESSASRPNFVQKFCLLLWVSSTSRQQGPNFAPFFGRLKLAV